MLETEIFFGHLGLFLRNKRGGGAGRQPPSPPGSDPPLHSTIN